MKTETNQTHQQKHLQQTIINNNLQHQHQQKPQQTNINNNLQHQQSSTIINRFQRNIYARDNAC